MSLIHRSNRTLVAIFLTITAFSCSLPFFSRPSTGGNGKGVSADKKDEPRPAQLSGVIEFGDGCKAGYYQIKLQGIFEGANVQIESQSDQSGHFNLTAPPGRYLLLVNRENCASKQAVELEQNTEHMLSIPVNETKMVEKSSEIGGRLPASVLIEPKK